MTRNVTNAWSKMYFLIKEVHLARTAFTFLTEEGPSKRLQTYFSCLETIVILTRWAVIDYPVTLSEQSISMD